MAEHSFEEIRSVALDILAGREQTAYSPDQFGHMLTGIAEVFTRREGPSGSSGGRHITGGTPQPLPADADKFLEVFWGLFRDGIITLGLNSSNREFPFFRLSEFGKRLVKDSGAYFFHDVSTYEALIRKEVSAIDDVTMIYLKEAMQAFRSGCILSASVMLGVATEHTFLVLIETIENNSTHAATFANVSKERTILQKVNKFMGILDQQLKSLPPEIKEDLDTHFAGILSIIRNFRNQSGHPSGKIIDREQAFILLQLFIPYCKKMYLLIDHYK